MSVLSSGSSSKTNSQSSVHARSALCVIATSILLFAVPSIAECDAFCNRIPTDVLESVGRCGTCVEEHGEDFAYDQANAGCQGSVDGCCETWCQWVPSNTKGMIPRCRQCDTGEVSGLLCPGWCGWVPVPAQALVPPCANRCM